MFCSGGGCAGVVLWGLIVLVCFVFVGEGICGLALGSG